MTEQTHHAATPRPARLLAYLQTSLGLPRDKAIIALALGAAASLAAILLNTFHSPLASMCLAFGLAWASLVDIDRLKLPNVITIGLIVVGLIEAAALGWHELIERSMGAAVGYLSFVAVASVYQHLRGKPGLGFGDAKLLAAGGAWLGWSPLPLVVLTASAIALVLAVMVPAGVKLRKHDPLVFGPFLGLAIFSLWI